MRNTTYPPEALRHRITKVKSQLRWLQAQLRLAEAERRDRERIANKADRGVRHGIEGKGAE